MFCPVFFFFNDTATTEIYTLSLHDALPIFIDLSRGGVAVSDLPQGFTVGQVLPLRFESQDGTFLTSVKGQVVWTSGEKVGFTFVDLTPRDVATLERLMAVYGSANPLQTQ